MCFPLVRHQCRSYDVRNKCATKTCRGETGQAFGHSCPKTQSKYNTHACLRDSVFLPAMPPFNNSTPPHSRTPQKPRVHLFQRATLQRTATTEVKRACFSFRFFTRERKHACRYADTITLRFSTLTRQKRENNHHASFQPGTVRK